MSAAAPPRTTAPDERSAGGSSAKTIEQRHRSTADKSNFRRGDDAQGIDLERLVTEADIQAAPRRGANDPQADLAKETGI
jgi:hypothetical protein